MLHNGAIIALYPRYNVYYKDGPLKLSAHYM